MDLYRGLSGEARELVHQRQAVMDRLPRTFLANTVIELEKWPALFEPEKAYLRTLLAQLAAMDAAQFQDTFGSLRAFEEHTGCNRVAANDPDTLQTRLFDHVQNQDNIQPGGGRLTAYFRSSSPWSKPGFTRHSSRPG